MTDNIEDKTKSTEWATANLVVENLFNRYHQQWLKEIQYLSSSDKQYENKYYKMIIDLGWAVVPYIIDSLRKKPTRLLEALSQITSLNPEKPEHLGNLSKMANDWISWWDIYSTKKE
jgi:hypothetical protein